MRLNLKSLISKLNDTTRGALEGAAGLCVSRAHYDIELEHYLLKTLDGSDNDIAAILRHFGVDKSRLTAGLAARAGQTEEWQCAFARLLTDVGKDVERSVDTRFDRVQRRQRADGP